MLINHLSKSLRYTGRWNISDTVATTTSLGATIELAFSGSYCVLLFDVNMNAEPFPHIYIQLDDGAKIETRIENYIRIEAQDNGNHILKLIYKSAMEMQPRWHEPLIGKISFKGAEIDAEATLPEDNRKIIEFIGDSITEGIWVDEDRKPYSFYQKNMVFQNDSTATYAYLTAQALGMRPYIMGYGAVGITKGGNGGVPKVSEAYPYYFGTHTAKPSGAEVIVINHGANDFYAEETDYIKGYEEFLDLVRKINPLAKIVVLSAFYGVHNEALGKMVDEYNKSRNENVFYIDSAGWIPKEPLHPAREGHKVVAEKLTLELKKILD